LHDDREQLGSYDQVLANYEKEKAAEEEELKVF